MGLVWALIIGIAAGWLAGQIMKGSGFGLLGDLIVGVIGSFIGHALFNVLGLASSGILGQLIVSTVGAVVLLFLLRLISRKA